MDVTQYLFSPTGGTARAAGFLAAALAGPDGRVETVDLCDAACDFSQVKQKAGALAVIAAPAYGGRAPALAVQRLAMVRGGGAPAVVLAAYGGRAFEDTLAELADAAAAAGFCVTAGVAALAEHSIAREIAAGRPDAQDKAQLEAFARRIRAKLDAGGAQAPAIPGSRPYKARMVRGTVPAPGAACVRCGVCAAHCPAGAIDRADPARVDAAACISCMRCIAVCPHGAREGDAESLAAITAMLRRAYTSRKDNELFL